MSLVSVHMPSSMLGQGGGGGGGGGVNDPHINTLSPNTLPVSASASTITVTGTLFEAGSVVEIAQQDRPTTFVSATSLTVSFTPATAGTVNFTVRNPNDEESNSVPFVITAAAGDPEPEADTTSGNGTPPTEVVPGDPGEFLPKGCAVPENISALREIELEMESLKKWKKGEHVAIGTGNVHWDGEDWAKGIA